MSCCCPWHSFKPADQAHSWLCRKWVTLVLALFVPVDQGHPWLCREWVTAVPGTISYLLIEPTIGSAACESLLSQVPFCACWASHPCLCSLWVAAVPSKLSCLLIKLTLGSAVCELLLFLAPFHVCWQSSPLALQYVSCCCLWHLFKPADQAHSWLCSLWVAAVLDTLLSLLIKPTFGSSESELLLYPVPIKACWSSPPLNLQIVSCCCPWHPFMSADKTHSWLCRQWVAVVPDTLLHVDQAHPWLCRLWVAAVPDTLLSLVTELTVGSAESELLLSLMPFHACWPSPPLALQTVRCHCLWQLFVLAD